MEFIKGLLSSVLFWKYYHEEEGYERDVKLQEINPYLFPSNALLAGAISGLINVIMPETAAGGLLTFLTIIVMIGQFIFQGWTGDQAIKRNLKRELGIESFKELFKESFTFLKNISVLFSASLIYSFASILDEFFADYEEEDKNDHSYYESNNETKKDKSNKIETIFVKYDIPSDADEKVISKRFRALSKQYHPDMPNGDEKKFIELKKDIEFLLNFIKENRQECSWA